MTNTPLISVIIPVHNDTPRLRLCLAALVGQSYPHYEIIVVDNGSSEPLDALRQDFPQVRFLQEPTPGSYVARNTGVRAALGVYLAFTDSDCIPAWDWLAKGVQHLQQPGVDIVGGKIDLFFADPHQPTAVELYESLFAFRVRVYIEKFNYTVTANLFTTKEVFQKVGAFNAALFSGGDREWCNRALASGYALRYADEVRIMHPARRHFSELWHKERRTLGGWRALQKGKSHLYNHFVPPLKSTGQIIASRRFSWRQKLLIISVLWRLRSLRAWYVLTAKA